MFRIRSSTNLIVMRMVDVRVYTEELLEYIFRHCLKVPRERYAYGSGCRELIVTPSHTTRTSRANQMRCTGGAGDMGQEAGTTRHNKNCQHTNFCWEDGLVVKLRLHPGHEVVDVLGCGALDGLLDGDAISP